jgi:hypothetical protein
MDGFPISAMVVALLHISGSCTISGINFKKQIEGMNVVVKINGVS